MKLSLVVKAAGKQEGQVLPIALPQFVVGRDPECHLRPASPMISKRHCALLQREGKAFIRDFGSTNGTSVNDQPVKDEAELHNNDRLKIGPLLFEVRITQDAPAAKEAAPKPPAKAALKAAPAAAAKTPAKPPPVPVKKSAPIQKTSAEMPAASAGDSEDDDIAAMLMSIEGDDAGFPTSGVDIPEGSTVMEMIVPPPGSVDPNKPADKGKDKPKASGNTASAAKSILEQYMKRPRG